MGWTNPYIKRIEALETELTLAKSALAYAHLVCRLYTPGYQATKLDDAVVKLAVQLSLLEVKDLPVE